MTRVLFTIDNETIQCLKLFLLSTGEPASLIVREAVKAYTRWKKPQPKVGSFDGIDQTPGGEATVEYD